jgi:hypothetical protein
MTSFHGRFQLGYKTSSTQEPGLLGDEYDLTAVTLDTATDMLNNTNSGRVTVRWVQNKSGAAIVPGTLVAADVADDLDINVKTCGVSDNPIGIADPFLTSNVADGESFFIVTRANRIKAKTSAAYTKGASLQGDSVGKLAAGAGTAIRALEAATGADEMKAVCCNFSDVGVKVANTSRLLRVAATTAQVNAGLTLLPAVPNVKYRIHDMAMISVGGAASGATTVDILGTQSASSVKLMASAVAGLTQNTLLRAGATNGTILASGASFADCDVNTAVTIGVTGSPLATSTHVHVLLTYEIVSA